MAATTRTVVLVGGGHAHVQLLRRWAMRPPQGARLIVVLDRAKAVYSGMVPGFVAGDYPRAALEIDVLPLARRAGAGVILTAARDLDPVRQEIALEGRPPIRFDLASLDVGSTVRGLSLPGVAKHALTTRPIGRFVRELEERLAALAALDGPARVLVVGGGAAGCELTFTLDARLRAAGLAPALALVTGDGEVLAGGARRTRAAIFREAKARSIDLFTGRRALRVDEAGVVVEHVDPSGVSAGPEELLSADLVVWATGAAPIAFPRGEGVGRLAVDDAGFLEVSDTLQCVGFENVFAVGDCARLVDHRWVPKAGVYAVRQGPILDHNLRARLLGRRLRPYRPQRDFLSLLCLGGERALGTKWGIAARGRALWRLKDAIDRRFMGRFQVLDEAGVPRPALERLGAMGADDDDASDGPGSSSELSCGGCAAKLGAEPLAAALAALPAAPADESVVLGLDARDDVAATRTAAGDTTLHNIDVIRAFCDDPYLVGRVAASNATSDLYAKGGRPRHAQATIGLPDAGPEAAQEMLFQALSGVRSILDSLGVSLLGGHTTIGDELTVGLAVTGDGPAEGSLLRQVGGCLGDALLLTQPLGTGVLLAADMRGWAPADWVEATFGVMQQTNEVGTRLAESPGVHAATDVTGFGLAGHLLSLLAPTDAIARVERGAVPMLPGARSLWTRGLRSTAHPANRDAFAARVIGAQAFDEAWLFDPQTAGGLLLAVEPERVRSVLERLARAGFSHARRIGTLAPGARPGGRIEVVDSALTPSHDAARAEVATLGAP